MRDKNINDILEDVVKCNPFGAAVLSILAEDPMEKWDIEETTKRYVIEDVLNNKFERPANDEEDWVWCYLLINFNKDANSFSKEVYYVGQKNAQNFDLNILRKDFTYICKLTCYATL